MRPVIDHLTFKASELDFDAIAADDPRDLANSPFGEPTISHAVFDLRSGDVDHVRYAGFGMTT